MKRGPYKNRQTEYQEARRLRKEEKIGYKAIADILGLSITTVAHWVSDIEIDKTVVIRNAAKRAKKPLDELVSKDAIRRRLVEIRGDSCEQCGMSSWQGTKLTLEMHRLNGSGSPYADHKNIILLCPNCHSITPDYRKKSG